MRSRAQAVFAAVLVVLASAFLTPRPSAQARWQHLQGGQYEGAAVDRSGVFAFVAGDSRIHRSDDGGMTWEEARIDGADTNPDLRVRLRGFFFFEDPLTQEMRGICVGDGGVALRTVDQTNGQRWDDLNPTSRILDALGEPAVVYDVFMLEDSGTWRGTQWAKEVAWQ